MHGVRIKNIHFTVTAVRISSPKYEEESVRSQMDIKRKTCDIQTWEKHLFLDISSTNTDTLAASLY
jgi:hypothetical protein